MVETTNVKQYSRRKGRVEDKVPGDVEPVPGINSDREWTREGIALSAPDGDGGQERSRDTNDLENICPNYGHFPSDKTASSAKPPKNRWKASTKDSRQDAAMQRYIAAMRAHFEEVDQFELLTEIPCKREHDVEDNHQSSYSDRDSHHEREDGPGQLSDKGSLQAQLEPLPQTPLLDQASCSHERDLLPTRTRGVIPDSPNLAVPCVDGSGEEPESADASREEDSPEPETSETSPGSHGKVPEQEKATAFELGTRRSSLRRVSHGQSLRRRSCILPESSDNFRIAKRLTQPSLLSRLSHRMSIGLTDALQKLGLVGRQSSIAVIEDRQPIIQEENDGDLTVTDTCPQTTPRGASVPSSSCVSISQLEPCCATEPASPDLATEVGTIAGPATPAIQQQQQDTELVQQVASSDENQQHQAETVLSNHGSIRRKCLDPTPAVHFGIQLESSPQGRGDATTPVPPLTQLLQLCNQEVDIEKLPSMERLLGEHIDLASIHKIGEGTFAEAFRSGHTVFKIVPIEGDIQVNGEQQKKATDILAEVAIALTLSELRAGLNVTSCQNATSAFVETHGVGVCKGKYANDLVREWEAWDRKHVSENDPLDAFPESQLYIVFVVADGGADLEHFDQCTLAEAKSILQQVALALAVAEEACQFEHRDLHWGNLLIQRVPLAHKAEFKLRGTVIEVSCQGVLVTLIDFTLSRIRSLTGEVMYCDLSADPDLFLGPKGDCQAETYRRMKKVTKNHWHTFLPSTNCLWLHYVADVILTQKLKPGKSNALRDLRTFRKDVLQAKCAADAAFHTYFHGAWLVKQ